MVGAPVANYIVKEKLGNKMAGRERWNVRDKEFQLESGLAPQDRGYNKEPKRKQKTTEGADQDTVKHEHDFDVLGHGL